MTVEETSQLIQLILNSVLMLATCGLVLASLLIRHAAIYTHLQTVTQEYAVARVQGLETSDRAPALKAQLHVLRYRYRATQGPLLTTQASFLVLTASTLLLALRTLLPWNGLITGSLVFFNLGIGLFLAAIVLTLLELRASKASIWKELNQLLNLKESSASLRPFFNPGRLLPAARSNRRMPRPAIASSRRTG